MKRISLVTLLFAIALAVAVPSVAGESAVFSPAKTTSEMKSIGIGFDGYASMWRSAMKSMEDGQPKTALKKFDDLRKKADKKGDFAYSLAASIEMMKCEVDVDPDKLDSCIVDIEKRYAKIANPVDKAVLHAMVGSAYNELRSSMSWHFDADRKQEMCDKRDEHYLHVLDDMEAFVNVDADRYKPLTRLGRDGKLFGHDMLAVMVAYVDDHVFLKGFDEKTVHERAAQIYADNGNAIAEAMMRLPLLHTQQERYDLLMKMRDTEIGMDIAKEYVSNIRVDDDSADLSLQPFPTDDRWSNRESNNQDAQLRFIRWVKDNVAKSDVWDNIEWMQNSILKKQVKLSPIDDIMYAGHELTIKVKYNNVKTASIEVHRYNGLDEKKTLRTDGALVLNHQIEMGNDAVNVRRESQQLPVRGTIQTGITLPAGHYVVVVKGAGNSVFGELKLTTMKMVLMPEAADGSDVYVVDAVSGYPLEGVTVIAADREQKELERKTTDSCGKVTFAEGDFNYFRAERSDDDVTEWMGSSALYYSSDDLVIKGEIFTDRSIYRPGHTVNGNVMVYSQHHDDVKVCANETLKLEVRSPHSTFKQTISLTTNAMGTADFTLQLPDDAEVGRYSFSLSYAESKPDRLYCNESIRVEEYKRPTFDVTFDKTAQTEQRYSLGDSISVVGKAMSFNGVPVQGGKVKAKISGMKSSFWWWRMPEWTDMDAVELNTADDGSFVVPVVLRENRLNGEGYLYVYRVTASVTDQNGETHEGEWQIRVSKYEYGIQIEDIQTIDFDSRPHIAVTALNANGDKVRATGTYSLIRNDRDTVAAGTFTTDEPIAFDRSLPFGQYSIALTSTDSKGNNIFEERTFWVFHPQACTSVDFNRKYKLDYQHDFISNDSKAVEYSEDFIYTTDNTVSETKPAKLYFAPVHDDVFIYYNVYSNDKLMKSGNTLLRKGQYSLTVPYDKECGDGFQVHLMYVRYSKVHTMSKQFTYVRPEKKLNIAWSTFRDHLQPGAKEEWTLVVKDRNGRGVHRAELMAVMYDAALDRLAHHSWPLSLHFGRYVPTVWSNSTRNERFPSFGLVSSAKSSTFRRMYDYLQPYEHNLYRLNAVESVPVPLASPVFRGKAMADMAVGMGMAESDSKSDMMLMETVVASTDENAELADDKDFDNASVRSNFAETAFFMPHITTDVSGTAHIAFQLPESLTEWQFRALAHTQNMDYGMLESTVVVRKDFMVRPLIPRFVRWGDKACIAASIINQTDRPINGTVRMRLINPETEREVLSLKQPFTVEGNKTSATEFQFPVLEGYEGMDCEIIAMSGDTSDGEINHLPVLSSKQAMVETVPFYLVGNEEKVIDLSTLFNRNSATATQRKFDIDYTDTPAWMCIESLRSLTLPHDDDAVSMAAAVHANYRIVELLDSFPMLAQYEDRNTVLANAASARDKLLRLQKPNGGWSWFHGMESSYYITLSVCEQLSMIPHPTDAVKRMLTEGMAYLDNVELSSYEARKKSKAKSLPPSSSTLNYLYVSGRMPQRQIASGVKKMREAYLSSLEKDLKSLTMYGVANASSALRAFGHKKAANRFVESLRQHTTTQPGMGRFFVTDAAYYSWRDYRLPTQTAAMRAIASSGAGQDIAKELLDMQLWIITQKQVQKWDNPMNTIDVADLLLSISPDATFHKAELPTVTLDGRAVTDFVSATLNDERDSLEGRKSDLTAQGEVVAHIDEEQIAGGVGTMTVRRNSAGSENTISWGFVQAQFSEDLSRLNPYATDELSVTRQLYVYRDGKWQTVNDGDVLAVGDKVRLRHTVKADRDMDFVRLTAQHPACFEPDRVLSGFQWLGTRGGYLSLRDSHTDVFFDSFTRGSTTVDTEYIVNRRGEYQVGVSTVQCAYAKQFGGHTSGLKVVVK